MKSFIFQFFLFVFLLLFLSTILHSTFAINGCFCSSTSSCYSDGCTRKTIKADGTIDYNLCKNAGCGGAYNCCYDTSSTVVSRYFCLQQPPCCEEMARRNNSTACCWPERGWCHPYYCNQMSKPEQCGWYWQFHDGYSNSQQGYGCMKGSSPETLQPIYGLPPGVPGGQATATPQPSLTPTKAPTLPPTTSPTEYIFPTDVPTSTPSTLEPTQNIFPTNKPYVYPTAYVSNSPLFYLPSLKFPTINTDPLKKSVKNVIVQSEKILQIPALVVNKITQLDTSLEMLINQIIWNLINKLVQLVDQLVQ